MPGSLPVASARPGTHMPRGQRQPPGSGALESVLLLQGSAGFSEKLEHALGVGDLHGARAARRRYEGLLRNGVLVDAGSLCEMIR